MQLSFNLEDIKYLKIDYEDDNNRKHSAKLALKEKKENVFVALSKTKISNIEKNQKISVEFVTQNGLYKTISVIKDITEDESYTYYEIDNPMSLDYQQNRAFYRIMAEYDCIYTVDEGNGVESYNAVTYDISAGGVSIIMDENIISKEEMSVVICFPERDIKSHLKFVRCEIFEDKYKLSFEYTDLSERDYEYLSNLCINKQLKSM